MIRKGITLWNLEQMVEKLFRSGVTLVRVGISKEPPTYIINYTHEKSEITMAGSLRSAYEPKNARNYLNDRTKAAVVTDIENSDDGYSYFNIINRPRDSEFL